MGDPAKQCYFGAIYASVLMAIKRRNCYGVFSTIEANHGVRRECKIEVMRPASFALAKEF
jgi:hypothetical protein